MTEKTKRDQGASLILIMVIVGITIAGFAVILLLSAQPKGSSGDDAAASDFTGVTVLDAPQTLPDFTLINQDGELIRLSDLQGKPTLIFFGFTQCPDVCPATLSEFRVVHDTIGDDKVNFVF